jgi:hypothetical protein
MMTEVTFIAAKISYTFREKAFPLQALGVPGG